MNEPSRSEMRTPGGCNVSVLVIAALLVVASVAQAQTPAPAPGGDPQSGTPSQPAPKPVDEGAFPKSFKIPGTDLSIAFGGYVKVDFIQDFSAINTLDQFKVNSIPVGGSSAEQSGRTTIHARESRFNIDLRSAGTGAQHFRAFVEGDFFGDSNAFRLRQAYGEFGGLLGGQTWSTFQDISARPLTVDYEGPDGEVFVRQAMIRFTHHINSEWRIAVAAEDPAPQFAVPSDLPGAPRATMPDIPGYVRYERGTGHAQLAGLVRQLRFDSTGAADDVSATGWGLNATFLLPVGSKVQVTGLFAIGEGTARYIEGLSGQNLDAVLSSAGAIHALQSQSAGVGIILHWRPNLKSGFSVTTSSVEDDPALSAGTIDRLADARFNLFYTPYRLVDFAGELLWGERRDKDGREGDAWRFQFAVIFRLN